MTHVARHENFIDVAAGKTELPEGEMPGLKRRVDADIIHVVRQRLQLPLGKAKPPCLVVVGRLSQNPIGMLWNRNTDGAEVQ